MKIHVLSDLHNEFSVYDQASPDADMIVLAGDIDKGSRGIAWARLRWPDKKIIFVPGNHEYYTGEFGRVNDEMSEAGRVYDVHVLNPGRVDFDGVRFIGAVLWTDFRLFGQSEKTIRKLMLEAINCVNDFRIIDIDERVFSPVDSVKMHERDLKFLQSESIKKFEGPTVMVTHHLPSMLSVSEQYKKDPLSAYFASNVDDLMRSDVWIHGHTHDSFDYLHPNGARVVCNPRGYTQDEKGSENREFDPGKIIEL